MNGGQQTPSERSHRFRIFAWASYDFANHAFATSVLSVIFNVYFVRSLVPAEGARWFGMTIPGESLWGYLISAVMAVVLVLSPALGALSDRYALKRVSLALCAALGVGATLALFFARPGHLGYACVLAFTANLGYQLSLVFYNAFLNDLGTNETKGRVSGLGFAFGYVGGGLCLALNLAMLSRPQFFHLASTDPTLPVRASILVAGCWWLIFSLPTVLLVKDELVPVDRLTPAAFFRASGEALVQLKHTIRDTIIRPDLGRFLVSFLIYNDGIQTVILMASVFGAQALGMATSDLAACYLLIQFVAFCGAMVAGTMADRAGHKVVIMGTLAVFLVCVFWAAVIRRPAEFWTLGVLIGLVMGGAQAASRSLYSLLVPPQKAGEFFALFSIVGKAASLLGPFVFGVAAQAFGIRPAVASLGLFFLVGAAILVKVNERRGRALALAETGNPIR